MNHHHALGRKVLGPVRVVRGKRGSKSMEHQSEGHAQAGRFDRVNRPRHGHEGHHRWVLFDKHIHNVLGQIIGQGRGFREERSWHGPIPLCGRWGGCRHQVHRSRERGSDDQQRDDAQDHRSLLQRTSFPYIEAPHQRDGQEAERHGRGCEDECATVETPIQEHMGAQQGQTPPHQGDA